MRGYTPIHSGAFGFLVGCVFLFLVPCTSVFTEVREELPARPRSANVVALQGGAGAEGVLGNLIKRMEQDSKSQFFEACM